MFLQWWLPTIALLLALTGFVLSIRAYLATSRTTRVLRQDIERELSRLTKCAIVRPLYVEAKQIADFAERQIARASLSNRSKDHTTSIDSVASTLDAFWLYAAAARGDVALLGDDIHSSITALAHECDLYYFAIKDHQSERPKRVDYSDDVSTRLQSLFKHDTVAAQKLESLLRQLPEPSFEFDQSIEITTTENIDDYQEIPNDELKNFIHVTIAAGGNKWRFHKSDVDPWPSELHGHNIANKMLKLDATNGFIYLKRVFQGKLSPKELKRVQAGLLASKDLAEKARRVLGASQALTPG